MATTMEATWESADGQIDKEDVECIYSGIKLSHEQEENPAIYNNMIWTWEHYAKWNKSEKDK